MQGDNAFPPGTTCKVLVKLSKHVGVEVHVLDVTHLDGEREIALWNYLLGEERYRGAPFLFPISMLDYLQKALSLGRALLALSGEDE